MGQNKVTLAKHRAKERKLQQKEQERLNGKQDSGLPQLIQDVKETGGLEKYLSEQLNNDNSRDLTYEFRDKNKILITVDTENYMLELSIDTISNLGKKDAAIKFIYSLNDKSCDVSLKNNFKQGLVDFVYQKAWMIKYN